MVLVRLRDRRIVMHNAIALDEPRMRAIGEWGEVSPTIIGFTGKTRSAELL